MSTSCSPRRVGRRVMRTPDTRELGAIFLGGAAGALLRVWLGRTFSGGGDGWPWVTFASNVTGCLALGYLAARLHERLPQSTYRWPLLGTGFCGAYTTFATMQVEVLRMLDRERYGLALAYVAASVGAGYLAVWLATAAVRRVRVLA
jgi:fluoride exporter